VVADPHELRRREAGQRVVAGDLDQPLATDRRPDRVALDGGALVVPEDRGAEDGISGIEQNEPVHLAGEADRHDVGAGCVCGRQGRPDCHDRRVPPRGGILLAPHRVRRARPVFGRADATDGAGLIDEDRFRGRRRDVDPEDERHLSGRRSFSPLAAPRSRSPD
jgi:hypothetical protein